ncbi:MAG TPA: diguanylate cyclase, partial [Pseudomonadales bacterium]|nr:diguanylate cyclase [Pseudomonadales bacterium]
GKLGRTPDSSEAQILRETLMLPVTEVGRDNELIIQVANFTYHKPGIVTAPEIDRYDALLVKRERALTLQMFMAGAIFLMGIYHIGLYILRRNDYAVLFFGLMSCLVSVFIWISEEGFYSYAEYVPNNIWWFMYFLCWILGVALVLMFTMAIFPAYEIRKISLAFLVTSYVGVVAIILLPVRLYFDYNGALQWVHLLLGIYLMYIGVRAVIARVDGSLFFMLATLIIAVSVGNDILVAEQKIKSIYLTGRGVFVFVCLQSFILAQRSARAYQTIKEHSVELEVLKKDLEKQVEARTSALHIALKETRKMNERLINISRTDALTTAFNRRYFVERLDEEWRRAMREKNRLVLLIIDIDHFKQFNDRHGHLCGDHCLRHVAVLIKQHFQRAVDFVARYGGEEFAVLVYGDTTDNVFQVAERLQKELSERPFEFDGQKLYVTLSMGIGELVPTADFRQDSLIRIADNAMYKAKATGRNRIVRADSGVRDL